MHGVPARSGGLDQVSAGQHVKQAAGPLDGGAEERGGGVPIKIGTRVQARQPERPRGAGVEVPVGPGEHGSHRGVLIFARIEHVQPLLLILQLARQVGERAGRVHSGDLGGHPQRQRQPRAPRGQLRGGAGSGVNPAADQRAQQADRIRHRQQVQVQPLRTVSGHQAGQRIAAGHQRHAARSSRQQRPYLPGPAGIVQDDQHPPAGQQAPVPGRALLGLGRDIRPGHAQGTQESRQRFACRHRLARTVAAQVHVQLAVREPPGHLMRPLERQRRLPHPSRPADRRDHHRPRRRGQGPGPRAR